MAPKHPTMSHDSLDAVIAAYMLAVEAGDVPNREELLDRHTEHADALRAFFADLDRMDRVASPLRVAGGPDETGAADGSDHTELPISVISATTSYWKRSPAAGWGSFTKHGRYLSTGWPR